MSYMLSGRLRPTLCAALLGLVAAVANAQAPDVPPSHPFAQSRPVPGRYIVVFKKDVPNPAAEAATHVRGAGAGAQLHHTYSVALKGFAATC